MREPTPKISLTEAVAIAREKYFSSPAGKRFRELVAAGPQPKPPAAPEGAPRLPECPICFRDGCDGIECDPPPAEGAHQESIETAPGEYEIVKRVEDDGECPNCWLPKDHAGEHDHPLEGAPREPESYRYKTSEEAELLPLPLQILRLKEINARLCNDHNTLVIMNARSDAALRALTEERDRAREAIVDVLSHFDNCNKCGQACPACTWESGDGGEASVHEWPTVQHPGPTLGVEPAAEGPVSPPSDPVTQIPEDLRNEYDLAGVYGKYPFSTEFVRILIERIGRTEAERDAARETAKDKNRENGALRHLLHNDGEGSGMWHRYFLSMHQVFAMVCDERDALRAERDRAQEALRAVLQEYEDQRSQFGQDRIWIKYEDRGVIQRALDIVSPSQPRGATDKGGEA